MTGTQWGLTIGTVLLCLFVFRPLFSPLLKRFPRKSSGTAAGTTTATPAPAGPPSPFADKAKWVKAGIALAVLAVIYFYSWAGTPPGKEVMKVFGTLSQENQELIFWFIKATFLLAAGWILYRTFFAKAAGGAKASDGSSTWLLWLMILIMVAGFSSLVTREATKSPVPSLVRVPIPTFDKLGIGRSVAHGTYESTYLVTYAFAGPANTGKRLGVCIKVTKPQAVPVAPIYDRSEDGNFQQTFRFSEGTQNALKRYGPLGQEIEMTFEQVLVMQGQNACEVIMMKMAG